MNSKANEFFGLKSDFFSEHGVNSPIAQKSILRDGRADMTHRLRTNELSWRLYGKIETRLTELWIWMNGLASFLGPSGSLGGPNTFLSASRPGEARNLRRK